MSVDVRGGRTATHVPDEIFSGSVKAVAGSGDSCFHLRPNLHVIDIVQEFHPWRVYLLAYRNTPSGVIRLIIGMIDLTIQ